MISLDDMETWRAEELRKNYEFTSEKVDQLMLQSCDCLPSCVSLNYETLSYEIATLPQPAKDQQRTEAHRKSRESNVMIHFEDAQFLKTKRSEIYGWGDFIANCGGLLGKSF